MGVCEMEAMGMGVCEMESMGMGVCKMEAMGMGVCEMQAMGMGVCEMQRQQWMETGAMMTSIRSPRVGHDLTEHYVMFPAASKRGPLKLVENSILHSFLGNMALRKNNKYAATSNNCMCLSV